MHLPWRLRRAHRCPRAWCVFLATLLCWGGAAGQNPPAGSAASLLATAETALAKGDYQAAMDRAAAAQRAFQQRQDQAGEGDALNVIGRAHWFRGNADAALPALQQGLALARATGDANKEIGRLNNVGNVYFSQGRYANALQSYETALARVQQTRGEAWNPRRHALTLVSLAILYEQLGQSERALTYYQQARAIPSALPPAEQAQVLSNLGTLYRRLGDPGKALDTYSQAQKLFQHEHQADAEIHVWQNIGIVKALDLHDYPGALTVFTNALSASERISSQTQVTLSRLFRGETFLRMGRLSESRTEFSSALRSAERTKADEDRWTALYGLGRVQQRNSEPGAALASFQKSVAVIETLRSGLGAATLKSAFLSNKRDVYDSAIALLLEDQQPRVEAVFDLMEQSRARNFQETPGRRTSRLSLAQAQARLDASTALLEYWITPERLAVLWMTKSLAGVRSVRLDAEARQTLETAAHSLSSDSGPNWRAAATAAGQLLIAGIPALQNSTIHKLVVVPDGALYQLPLEALIDRPGGAPAVATFTIWYLPSAASLASVQTGSAWPRPPWSVQAEAFGNPDTAESSGKLPSDEVWARLPYSEAEILAIASLLPGRVRLHLGTDDVKRALLAPQESRPPLLHISTHAAVDLSDPERSRILFSPERDSGSQYLFWQEVLQLRLTGVDLVTLSACDTERGKVIQGEGVQSFSRAFLGAGAASTVTTLWRVADQPTSEFMRQFYYFLAQGMTKAEALRGAKRKLLGSSSALSHPVYWAAFVLHGEGDRSVPPYLSGMALGIAATALFLAGVLAMRRVRALARR